FAEGLDGLVRQPGVRLCERFLASVDFHPRDFSTSTVRIRYGRIEHAHARAPDVRAGSVPFDEWNDWLIGNDESSLAACDGNAALRRLQCGGHGGLFLGQVPRQRRSFLTVSVENSVEKRTVYVAVMPQSECFSG